MELSGNIHSSFDLRDPNTTQATIPHIPQLLPHVKECRICLNGAEDSRNKLVSPCECQGSMRYVHQICLKQWLEVKALRDIDGVDGQVECELCKTWIRVELQVSRECSDWQSVKKKIAEKWILFLVCAFGVMFSIALMVYSALQLGIEIKNGYKSAPIIERIVVIASIGLNCLLLFFFMHNLSKFCLKKKAQLKVASG